MLTSTETVDANMSEVATELLTFSHYTSLLALSVTSPFYTCLLTVLQSVMLNFGLSFNYLFSCLRNNAPNILRNVKSAAIDLHSKFKSNQTDSDPITFESVPPLNRISSNDHCGSTKHCKLM